MDVFARLRIDLPIDNQLVQSSAALPRTVFKLPFDNQRQIREFWCWAAVTRNITHAYNPSSTATQCSVADDTLQTGNCCSGGEASPCNQAYYLNRALAAVQHFNNFAAADARTVRAEVTRGRPPGIRVEWPDQTAHFVAVYGYVESAQAPVINKLHIADPLYGDKLVKDSSMFGRYHAIGTWTDTYLTM